MAKPKRATIDQSEITPVNTNMFADTAAGAPRADPAAQNAPAKTDKRTVPAKEKVRAVSVALTNEEYEIFDQIAAELKPLAATRMAVMNYALRRFLQDYQEGKLQITTKAESGRVVITD